MSKASSTLKAPRPTFGPLLGLTLAFPILGCAASKPVPVAIPPIAAASPAPTVTIVAIRPVTSTPDPTGSLQRIATILGQPVTPAVSGSEIVMQLRDNSIKTSVQGSTTLAVGSEVAISTGLDATVQP